MSAITVTLACLAIVIVFLYVPTLIMQSSKADRFRQRRVVKRPQKKQPPQEEPKPKTPLEQLLEDLGQDISIDDELNEETFAKCNHQEQSTFFTVLPREVRDLIYEFASAQYEDQEHKYEVSQYYCRPGHTARQKTDWSFLLTCRRVWLEANAHPMLQAEHCYWKHRPAPDRRDEKWMARLTPNNRKNFGHLHLFAQMFAIEGLRSHEGHLSSTFFLPNRINVDQFQPRAFTVTIRHTDWWSWESEAPLRLKYSWVDALLNTPDLRSTQVFKLELETLDYKVVQLRPIIERIRGIVSKELTTHIVNGKPTTTRFVLQGEPDFFEWRGPTNINGTNFPQYAGKTELRYHVFTLTWHLEFPELGRIHIANMRRAPRLRTPTPADTMQMLTRQSPRFAQSVLLKRAEARQTVETWRENGSLLKVLAEK